MATNKMVALSVSGIVAAAVAGGLAWKTQRSAGPRIREHKSKVKLADQLGMTVEELRFLDVRQYVEVLENSIEGGLFKTKASTVFRQVYERYGRVA